jgi:hypothetical protein
MPEPVSISDLTVRDLRRRWKPHKERLRFIRSDHPTLIRFHRAISWLERVEKMDTAQDSDLALIGQWIAFNALYGQWDHGLREPVADRECWRVFMDRTVDLDRSGYLAQSLTTHKRLVLSLLDDQYLSSLFWRDPESVLPGQIHKEKHAAATWFIEQNWKLILERLMERIYMIRCQLVHGAATYGGQLNRTSLRHCVTMLGHLMPAILLVLIDHGADEDWGIMCYPPMDGSDHRQGPARQP